MLEKSKSMVSEEVISSTVNLVTTDNIAMVWGQVEKWLNKGERFIRGYYNNNHLYNAVMAGQMQLWIALKDHKVRTVMLTQLDFYPECIQFRYVFIAGQKGSFREIIHAFKSVELWAMQHGATKGCIIGREGWVKLLSSFGYHKKSVMLIKDLVNTSQVNGNTSWRH